MCFVFGLVLLGVMLVRLDPGEVMERLEQAGVGCLAVLGVHLVSIVFMALGFRYTISNGRRIPFGLVLRAYWSGHAINGLTPGRSLGNVLAASLLRDRGMLKGEEMVASLVNLGFMALLATVVFLLLGPLVCLAAGYQVGLNGSLLVGALAILVPLGGLWLLIRSGAAGRVVRLVGRIPALRPADWESWLSRAGAVDRQIKTFLGRGSGGFWLSLACWLVVRLLQVVEVWILVLVMLPGQPLMDSWLQAVTVQAGAHLVCGILSFVPGQVGVAEGGSAYLFGLMGLAPVSGFALELIRRLCKLIGIAVGLVLGSLALLRSRSTRNPGG